MTRTNASRELKIWSDSLLALCDKTFFAASGSSAPHRNVAVLSVLQRNANQFLASELDQAGALYGCASLVLAAGCRRLGLVPSEGNWGAAIENVASLREQIGEASAIGIGLPIGTPASVFKDQLDTALANAGVTAQPTNLDDENRRVALGMAMNLCMRFMVAYALECPSEGVAHEEGTKDLGWIRGVIGG